MCYPSIADEVLFDLSFDAHCVLFGDELVRVNDRFCALFGCSKANPGKITDYFCDDKQPCTEDETELRMKALTGRQLWARWRQRIDGDYRFCVIRDITQDKVINDQIGRYIRQLRAAVYEARFARDEAETLAYAASHDLQEPLRTIANWAAFIDEDFGPELPAVCKEQLSYILDAARRGSELVSDLLRLSRLRSPGEFSRFDSSTAVDGAVLDLELMVQETRATITRVDLPHICADPSMIRLLFKNLLSNAMKFAKESVPPEITISCKERGEDWEFRVEDNGIGIPPDQVERVFGVFRRLDRTKPGTGIGLALSHKIIVLHEGRIGIDRNKSNGTTVFFTVKRSNEKCSEHSVSGGSSSGCKDDGARTSEDDNSVSAFPCGKRKRCSIVLASRGKLRDRPESRSRFVRSESTKHVGVHCSEYTKG